MSDLNHDCVSNRWQEDVWCSTISPTPLPPPVTRTTYTMHVSHLQLNRVPADLNDCLPYF